MVKLSTEVSRIIRCGRQIGEEGSDPACSDRTGDDRADARHTTGDLIFLVFRTLQRGVIMPLHEVFDGAKATPAIQPGVQD